MEESDNLKNESRDQNFLICLIIIYVASLDLLIDCLWTFISLYFRHSNQL